MPWAAQQLTWAHKLMLPLYDEWLLPDYLFIMLFVLFVLLILALLVILNI